MVSPSTAATTLSLGLLHKEEGCFISVVQRLSSAWLLLLYEDFLVPQME